MQISYYWIFYLLFCHFFTAWITEKDTLISTEYGKDLASVQTLQRKHETLERDLAALEDKVRALAQEVSNF